MIKLLILLIITCGLSQRSNQEIKVTYVTGLWDVSRGDMLIFKRPFDYYLRFFKDVLQVQDNVIIFGDSNLKKFVEENRKYKNNILFVEKDLKDIQKYWYTQKIWKVLDDVKKDWIKWQKYSILPQYGLRMYNPIVMSKMRFISQASKLDPFNSDYFIWIDGGLTHSFDKSILEQGTFRRTERAFQIDWLVQTGKGLPYHPFQIGFKQQGRNYADVTSKQRLYVWGNWLGGKATAATTAYNIFQNFLRITLQNGQMNTDEALLFLMLERYNYLYHRLVDPDTFGALKNINLNISIVEEKYSLRQIKSSQIIKYASMVHGNDEPCIQSQQIVKIFKVEDRFYYQLVLNLSKFTLKVRLVILFGLVLFFWLFRVCIKRDQWPFQHLDDKEDN